MIINMRGIRENLYEGFLELVNVGNHYCSRRCLPTRPPRMEPDVVPNTRWLTAFRNKGLLCGSLYSYNHASSVSIVTGGLENRDLIPEGAEVHTFAMTSSPILRPTQLPIRWVPRVLSSWVKRSEREADHSPVSSRHLCFLL